MSVTQTELTAYTHTFNEFATVPSRRKQRGKIKVMISRKFPRANNKLPLNLHLFASTTFDHVTYSKGEVGVISIEENEIELD